MTEPLVCAVMLTRDRPELAKRAVECFRAQTYLNKRLLIWNTGDDASLQLNSLSEFQVFAAIRNQSIGTMRNFATEYAGSLLSTVQPGLLSEYADIIVHWDDDDWSHPNRIAEQVALLQASGADVVGYNEMLFWREARCLSCGDRMTLDEYTGGKGYHGIDCETGEPIKPSEAWLYSNPKPPAYALGTSLCYWRKTWERHRFADETQGVEDHWIREKKLVSFTSLVSVTSLHIGDELTGTADDGIADPRMIACIHGGNTSNGYKLEEYVGDGSKQFPRDVQWKRVPERDERVRGILA